VRRRLEFLVPVLALLGFLAAALMVNLLLTSAEDRGVEALEESVTGEVEAIARSQDQRVQSQIAGASEILFSGDSAIQFDLEVGSPADEETLSTLLGTLTETLDFGFYLVDASGVLTQGFHLEEEHQPGQPFDWPGFEEAVGDPTFPGGVLPVSQGLTTGQPATATVYPLGRASGREGYFVFENPVNAETNFNQEISALERGETGEYIFFDSAGTVIAAKDDSLIAEPVDDERLVSAPLGVHRFDGHIAVLADVPSAGWRIAFRQDTDEFEQSLTGPLQSAGRILVLALLAAGLLLMGVLYRRLAGARAEQERLRELSESQQEFISIVSHELRTPVAGVLGFLETTLDHWEAMDDVERHNAVGRAASKARRLQAMTRDVLDTQSVEAGRLMYVFERLDLAAEVQVAVDAARDQDAERSVNVQLPGDPVWVSGDPDRLQQVLANLIDNARKNSPAVVPVDVMLDAGGGEARVTVSDHGAGIAEESLERIFDKFVRGRGESVSGTGLGLYISRQIIDAHGGRVWAESPPGEGAVFRFVLPLAAGETAPEMASTDVSTD
jgi:signal transduction histidine kinase